MVEKRYLRNNFIKGSDRLNDSKLFDLNIEFHVFQHKK